MLSTSERDIAFTAAAALCAGIASIRDVRDRKIPNLLTGSSVVIAVSLHFYEGGWRAAMGALAAGLICGSVMLLLFLAGGMGAGDVKLMVAIGCFAGLTSVTTILLAVAFSGAIFGMVLGLCRGRFKEIFTNAILLVRHHREKGLIPHGDLNIDNPSALSMPFAVPVTAGCLFTMSLQLWGG